MDEENKPVVVTGTDSTELEFEVTGISLSCNGCYLLARRSKWGLSLSHDDVRYEMNLLTVHEHNRPGWIRVLALTGDTAWRIKHSPSSTRLFLR